MNWVLLHSMKIRGTCLTKWRYMLHIFSYLWNMKTQAAFSFSSSSFCAILFFFSNEGSSGLHINIKQEIRAFRGKILSNMAQNEKQINWVFVFQKYGKSFKIKMRCFTTLIILWSIKLILLKSNYTTYLYVDRQKY